MQVIVIGAGVIGVSTAYYLARSGHQVTVVERANHVAAGASHANGGRLSYSFTDAMASPAYLKNIPGFLFGNDIAVRVSNPFDPALIKWGSAFLRQCTHRRARENSVAALTLALRSQALLHQLIEDTSLDMAFRRAGKLVLIRNPASLERARQSSEIKQQHGCHTHVITIDEARSLEPALHRCPALCRRGVL